MMNTIQEKKQSGPPAPYTNAVVLIGEDGRTLLIIGLVRQAILESNLPELADTFLQEALQGDYSHLLVTCRRYVYVEGGVFS